MHDIKNATLFGLQNIVKDLKNIALNQVKAFYVIAPFCVVTH